MTDFAAFTVRAIACLSALALASGLSSGVIGTMMGSSTHRVRAIIKWITLLVLAGVCAAFLVRSAPGSLSGGFAVALVLSFVAVSATTREWLATGR